MHPLIASLKGKLIVSVQAYPGEPMRHPETMAQIARAADFAPRHLAVANIHDRVLIVQRQIMHHKLHVFAKMPL